MSNIRTRKRLNSRGDSVPASDTSEETASEQSEINTNWSSTMLLSPIQQKNITEFYNSLSDEQQDEISIPNDETLSTGERNQIECFFGGLGTEIFISSSLANLYEGLGQSDDWRLIFTGIPIILYDKGIARSRTTQKIKFCLAERGTCFSLWQDTIDNLSQYTVAGPSFHTMRYSSNHCQIIGFSFDSIDAATELWQHIEKLISDPSNISLNLPGHKKKKNKEKKIKPELLPPKSQISTPCQFQHVTNVNLKDSDRYYSMQALLPESYNVYRQ